MIITIITFLLVLLSSISSLNATTNEGDRKTSSIITTSPYQIVIDGGSTGSRLHIFEFVQNSNSTISSNNGSNVDCVRRGSTRVDSPLSSFSSRHSESQQVCPIRLREHMLPLFEYAASIIPSQYHADTGVRYGATAGMRLLTTDEQHEVYDALYEGLMSSELFVFTSMKRHDISTLDGDAEGFYGAVAANYLKGVIDTQLRTVQDGEDDVSSNDNQILGSLDMGGSSTQIVFRPESTTSNNSRTKARGQKQQQKQQMVDNVNDEETCLNEDLVEEMNLMTNDSDNDDDRLKEDDFFVTSYLSYGAAKFRERLLNTWIYDKRKEEEESYETDSCIVNPKMIDNPCSFVGYTEEYEGYTFVGTGNANVCMEEVKRLIPHHENVCNSNEDEECSLDTNQVGGIIHPPVQGKFFAMSLYFFTLDSLRHIGNDKELQLSWPTPTLNELQNALDGFCSRSWYNDLDSLEEPHKYTRIELLPHRCLESSYMITLLKDGFGFNPTSRQITFTFDIDGSEVEWSLGLALSLYSSSSTKDDVRHYDNEEHDNDIEEMVDDDGSCSTMDTTATTATTTTTYANATEHFVLDDYDDTLTILLGYEIHTFFKYDYSLSHHQQQQHDVIIDEEIDETQQDGGLASSSSCITASAANSNTTTIENDIYNSDGKNKKNESSDVLLQLDKGIDDGETLHLSDQDDLLLLEYHTSVFLKYDYSRSTLF